MANNDKLAVHSRKRILLYFLPAAGYAALIFALSSIPLDTEEFGYVFRFDKLLHLVEYYILGYLLMRAFTTCDTPFPGVSPIISATLVGIAFGISDEFHQVFVPGRDGSLMDLLFDAVGATLAACTFSYVRYHLGFVRTLENRIEAEVTRR